MINNNMKKRLLLVVEYLFKYTDENNTKSLYDIMDYLEVNHVPVQRKTVKSDIDLLIDMGNDIVPIKGSPYKYFWGTRNFELAELQMLIGAVSSSRFIDEKRSEKLINKLAGLCSEHQGKILTENVLPHNAIKGDNTNIYYIVDTIYRALERSKKLEFYYDEYDVDKSRIHKNDGQQYVVSPYCLRWNESYLYLLGHSEKHGKIVSFRIDRISSISMKKDDIVPLPEDVDLSDYSDTIFEMYDGKQVEVTLECDKDVVKYVIDKFGIDVKSTPKNYRTMIAQPTVGLSPTFYSWVFKFGGKIKITGPAEAVEGYKAMIKKAL